MGNLYKADQFVFNCNNLLTHKLLQLPENCLPLQPVISFSGINYVVSVRRPRESGEVSFFLYNLSGQRETELQSAFFSVFNLYFSAMEVYGVTYD